MDHVERCHGFTAPSKPNTTAVAPSLAQRDETRRDTSWNGALAGRDETAWGLDQSVSLVRELLGELRPRRILKPSMAELKRLAAARRYRATVGPE